MAASMSYGSGGISGIFLNFFSPVTCSSYRCGSMGEQHDPTRRAESGMVSIESANAAEHEELPFLLKRSNCAASATFAPKTERESSSVFFDVARYDAPPMRTRATRPEATMLLVMPMIR